MGPTRTASNPERVCRRAGGCLTDSSQPASLFPSPLVGDWRAHLRKVQWTFRRPELPKGRKGGALSTDTPLPSLRDTFPHKGGRQNWGDAQHVLLPLEDVDGEGAVVEARNAAAVRVSHADLGALYLTRTSFAAQLTHDLHDLRRAGRADRMAFGQQSA